MARATKSNIGSVRTASVEQTRTSIARFESEKSLALGNRRRGAWLHEASTLEVRWPDLVLNRALVASLCSLLHLFRREEKVNFPLSYTSRATSRNGASVETPVWIVASIENTSLRIATNVSGLSKLRRN